MSRKFDSPVTLAIGPSRLLTALLGTAYGGALVLSLGLPLPWWVRGVLSGALLWRGISDLRAQAQRRADTSIVGIALDDAGRHTLWRRADSTEREFRVLSQYLDPRLAVLAVRAEGSRRRETLLVPRDAVAEDVFRRWRARLQLQTSGE